MRDELETVTEKQAARILGLSHRTLESWRVKNKKANGGKKPHPDLKRRKIGGRIQYFKKCLLDYLDKNTFGEE